MKAAPLPSRQKSRRWKLYEVARNRDAGRTVFASGCKSWYLDADGVPQVWPWSYDHFVDVMAKPRLEDYVVDWRVLKMTQVMKGVRVLEVAQFTFVPAAGAVLADWGADVIKIEHPVRGDTQRGFINSFGKKINPLRNGMIEHPNRGKRSVGIDISTPEGQALIYEIAKTADVFLTNYLPSARRKLKIDVEQIRAANPDIIYARGSAFGDKGPERENGGFDNTAFWTRSGVAYAMTPEELGGAFMQPIGAFGDSMGGMNIAGGISAALFHRERTGEPTEIDVSLLSTGWWACGSAIDQAIEAGSVSRASMPMSGAGAGQSVPR